MIQVFDFDKIHDITFIHLYNKHNTESFFPELTIKYDGGKSITCDYTHPQFNKLLKYVYDLYVQNSSDIILFDDFSKERVNDALNCGIWAFDDDLKLCEERQNDDLKLKMWSSYVWEVVQRIILKLKPDAKLCFKDCNSFKNKGVMGYTINGVEKELVFTFSLKEDEFNFKFSYLEDEVIPICASAHRYYGSLVLKYASTDGQVCDSLVYAVDDFGLEEFMEDEVINNEISAEELDIVNYYLSLLGIDTSYKISKATSNNYLFLGYTDEVGYECFVISGQVYIDDEVLILYKEEYGLSTFKHYLFTPLDSYVSLVKFSLSDDTVLREREFLPGTITTGEYKNKLEGHFALKHMEGAGVKRLKK